MGIVTVEKLENADKDADSLELFISGGDKENVKTRKAKEYPTLANAVRQVIETGGFEPFGTEEELLKSIPILDKKAAKALDTKKVWLWDGEKWNDTGSSELDLAIRDRDDFVAKGEGQSFFLTDKNGLSFGEIDPQKIAIYDLFEVQESTIDEAHFLDMKTGLAVPVGGIGDPSNDSEVITQIDTSKPFFSKQLCSFYDEPILINVPSLFTDRAKVQQQNTVIATIGSTDTLQAKSYYKSSRDLLEIETLKLGKTAQLVLRDVSNLSTTTKLALDVINVPMQSSKSVKILQLGDSITNRQSGTIIRTALEKRGFNPAFIGTLRGILNQNESANNATGELGEGREGWKTGDFTHSVLTKSAIAIGDESTYLAMTQSEKRTNWNPFVRIATDADSSTLIKNGYVFDPEFYRSRFSLDVPDVVVIALGINDVIPNTTTEIYNDYVLMLSQFLAQWSGVKIVVTLPTLSHQRNDVWKTAGPKVIREIQRAINTVNSSRVMLAPAWTFVPPDFGYSTPLSGGVLDEISGAITRGFDDQTHPIDAHRVKMWSSVSAYIAASVI